ncbi:MAG TPA: cytochrome c maturation protein CcmE [Thermoanaerobaculia bacterium]|nr:cytochrome c maturation protein CcmE [Thermoanaerobaculia bacterium]HUM29465.1 cytochrome c maturation protein CcmE [Thermoanaerobaculia bacterium]HXK67848.1 cytochrome c maturation protein CcmE [Thermoanaerobaculia bacterium]
MKTRIFLAVLLVLAFTIFALVMFRQSLTPYVSFKDAKSGRGVQVAGSLEPGSVRYDEGSQTLLFTMIEKDGTDLLPVAYSGSRPANFEEATFIVAIGAYDGKVFQADKLLVKCPSKYEGSGTEREYGRKQ